MESGRVKVDQQKKQYDFEIKSAIVMRNTGFLSLYTTTNSLLVSAIAESCYIFSASK